MALRLFLFESELFGSIGLKLVDMLLQLEESFNIYVGYI